MNKLHNTMKAITRRQYGSSEVLNCTNVSIPTPKENEVLIRVHYTSVNRTDCGILRGKPFPIRFFTGLIKPSTAIPGTDFAGEIVKIGCKVKEFKIGDRVWGLNDEGLASQSEYMTMAEQKAIVPIPNNVSYESAITAAEGAHYAFNMLNKIALKTGQKVLINGATGAIGSAALQILKSKGIEVTAVGNTKNVNLLKSLGADKVYDYQKEDFTVLDQQQYHVILDAVGKSSFGQCKHLLVPKGAYISSELGPRSENLYLPILTSFRRGPKVIFPIPTNCKRTLVFMNHLLEKEQFKPVIDKYFTPENIKAAYNYVESGEKTGNVLIDFS